MPLFGQYDSLQKVPVEGGGYKLQHVYPGDPNYKSWVDWLKDSLGLSSSDSLDLSGVNGISGSMDSDTSASGSLTDYDFGEYLEGLLSSVGAENEVNRHYNSAEARLNREFQSEEARIQREWYENLSSSAYTRAMADMRNAGLNPILAYSQGGASASGTSTASGSSASYQTGGGDTLSSILNSVANMVSSFASSAESISNIFKRKK